MPVKTFHLSHNVTNHFMSHYTDFKYDNFVPGNNPLAPNLTH